MGEHMFSHGKIKTHVFTCKKPTWEYLYLAEPGSNPRPNRDRTPDPKNNRICDRSGVHPGSNPEPLHPDRESLPLHYMCCYMSTTEIRVFLYLSKFADFCRFSTMFKTKLEENPTKIVPKSSFNFNILSRVSWKRLGRVLASKTFQHEKIHPNPSLDPPQIAFGYPPKSVPKFI